MGLLKNRKFACVVLAVCILSSIFLLGGGALRNDRHDVLAVYTEGTDTSLSTRHSMDAYLDRAAERANMLAEQATKLGADDALVQAVREGAAAVASKEQLAERHEAYAELTAKVETLYTALERDNIEGRLVDAKFAYSEYKGAVSLIQNDQYPAIASRFNDKLRGFPANLIAGLFGVEPLNTFGW
jgi:hypothetical protein